jgi:hypothetical protein
MSRGLVVGRAHPKDWHNMIIPAAAAAAARTSAALGASAQGNCQNGQLFMGQLQPRCALQSDQPPAMESKGQTLTEKRVCWPGLSEDGLATTRPPCDNASDSPNIWCVCVNPDRNYDWPAPDDLLLHPRHVLHTAVHSSSSTHHQQYTAAAVHIRAAHISSAGRSISSTQ